MIRYYLVQGLRNVIRNKGFSFLNIIGLTLGVAVSMLIIFFVTDELSYDKFNCHHDKIFRVDTELKYGGTISSFAITAPPVAEAILKSFPEVKHAVRIEPAQNIQFKKGDQIIREDRVMYADQSIFDVFSIRVIDGSTKNALQAPGSIVIAKSIAMRYFNAVNVAGQTITIANDNSLHTVSAVVDDMPFQSHFHADVFLPLSAQENSRSMSFSQFSFNTYLLLDDAGQAKSLNEKLQPFLKRHMSENMDVAAFEKSGNYINLELTPLTSIHLYSNKQRELEANGDVLYVYIFTTIAVLILGLACINFINLFTARSANRAKEVGIRKVLGSVRTGIMMQFLLEAFMMTLASVVAGIATAFLCLPFFNALTGKNFEFSFHTLGLLFPIIVIMTLILSVVAGFYPALYLSSFQAITVLKGKLSCGIKTSKLRSLLVVIQFSIATFLVVGTFVIQDQLQFIQSKNLGFNREHVLIINNASAMDDPEVMRQEVKELSGVVNASLSGYLPTGGARWTTNISSTDHQGLLADFWLIDMDYLSTLEMELVKGRNFSPDLANDSSAVVLNETAARILIPGQDYLEKKVETGGKPYKVIGVVKDFHFNTLRENVTPLVMTLGRDWRSSLIVRTRAEQLPTVLSQARAIWKKINPGRDFEFTFMDKDFETLYRAEQRMEKLFALFTTLALIIAGVGLLGLSAFAAEQRTRELSIRKILGASVASLFNLLTIDFIRFIIIAMMIALPAAWWTMEQWLSGFAYRVNIPVSTVLLSVALIILVALITISYQTLKAALNNPVDNLRIE